MMKGIYLAANIARHPNYDLVYQDIDLECRCDIGGNMLDIDCSNYDYIIATPPCNWWSKLNMYWYRSVYAWQTINLLPLTIIKLAKLGKPFIIENVINRRRFEFLGVYKLCEYYDLKVIEIGRHTYFTNCDFQLCVEQHQDFKSINGVPTRVNQDGYNQGGSNVHIVIEKWLSILHSIN